MPYPSAIAVFCGSKPGQNPGHLASATALGEGMARHEIELIYGGGRVGLMGRVADAVSQGGGKVTGIIPEFLMQREVGNSDAGSLEVTESMHSRKTRMFELSDAFVTLAGGLGTLDETIEVITWKQLRLHSKPIIVLNLGGYWDVLRQATQSFTEAGFAYASDADLFTIVDSVDEIFQALDREEWVRETARAGRL